MITCGTDNNRQAIAADFECFKATPMTFCYLFIELLLIVYLLLWLLRSTELQFGWGLIVQNRQAIRAPGASASQCLARVWRHTRSCAGAGGRAHDGIRISGNFLPGLVLCGCVRETLKAQPQSLGRRPCKTLPRQGPASTHTLPPPR